MEEQNFDIGSAIEKIQEMMSSDDGKAKIDNIISAFTGGGEQEESREQHPEADQMEMMLRLGRLMNAKAAGGEAGSDLIRAIKPYLKKKRQDKADGAVKIMGMLRAAAVLKESGFDFNLNL